ncbi:MAG: glycerol-3-phosphate 1-O-acyltransferase PlsB [Lysobacterales bacterium]
MATHLTPKRSSARLSDSLFGSMLGWLVKEKVLPRKPQIDPERPVCYVIESDALSNLLILQKACRANNLPLPLDTLGLEDERPSDRCVIGLQTLRGLVFRRPDWRPHLQELNALTRVLESSPDLDLQLVPVSIFLGRRPDKETGFFRTIFSENWTVAGRLRRLLAIILHGRNTLLQFSTPIELREALDENLGRPRTVRKISRLLRVHFRRRRTNVVGPDLSHRRTALDQILRTRKVRDAIRTESDKSKQSIRKVRRKASSYAREIAADYSHTMILIMSRLLGWFWNRIYDGVNVHNEQHLSNVPPGTEIVYVPCHRSHIDYLLVSYLVYHSGFAVPHIAAGVNLNLPVVGSLIRRCGAFYLRRSFRSNALYSTVFTEYLDTIFSRGVSLEYFIEGTRSRTGRLLKPQTGMLSMTVRSFLRHQERPVVFVPVYFGYEQLVEGDSYLGELSGGRKRKETLSGLLRSFSILKKKFGQMHVSYGEPIDLAGHLDHMEADWREHVPADDQRPKWLASSVDKLSTRIMRRINSAAVVNPMNLLAIALLSSPRNAMAVEDLEAQIDLLRDLMIALPLSPHTAVTDMSGKEVVAYCSQFGLVDRRSDSLGEMVVCSEKNAWLLSYFRNNSLHTVALYSWCACVFRNNMTFKRRDFERMARVLYPFLKDELFLPWSPDEFLEACNQCLNHLRQRGLLVTAEQPDELQRGRGETLEALQLSLLSQPIFSSLERFYITVALLVKNGSGTLSASELENQCHHTAKRLAVTVAFETPEYFDKALFRNFIRVMRREGVLTTADDGKLVFNEALEIVIRDSKIILSKEVRHNIWRLSPSPKPVEEIAA